MFEKLWWWKPEEKGYLCQHPQRCPGWQQMHTSRESHRSEMQWVPLSTVENSRLVRGEIRGLLFPLGHLWYLNSESLQLSSSLHLLHFYHPSSGWSNQGPQSAPGLLCGVWVVHWWPQKHSGFGWIAHSDSFCWWFLKFLSLPFPHLWAPTKSL